MRLDLTWDQVEPLVRQVLREEIAHIRTSPSIIFDRAQEQEQAERKEMIKAFRKVLSWYSKKPKL